MKVPTPSAELVIRFQKTVPVGKDIEVKKVFGQPSAFVSGNMFYGVFGERLFLRLSEPDRREMIESEKASVFEPMPGRAMKEYVTLPSKLLTDERRLNSWLVRSLAYARTVPKKAAKSKGR
ncbi:MAG: TfoX/Sxy family protein [Thermoplasmata archaeon]|nr:TfoX/Sxy family protein [Thermoplasmata archaeon]MCI4359575.1 TfoX/Sxy family protein [Thermoplasmata archaeon]